jgi:Fe2+ transport system protein B
MSDSDYEFINYYTANSNSIAMTVIIIIIFLLNFFYLHARSIYIRNKDIEYKDHNYYLYGESRNIMDDNINKMIKDYQKEIKENPTSLKYDDEIKETNEKIQKYIEDKEELRKQMIEEINRREINITNMSKNYEDVREYVIEKNTKNIENMKKLGVIYKERMETYVDGLTHTLSVINEQLDRALITPSLTRMVSPLHIFFQRVRETLISNEETIRNWYPSFNKEDVPILTNNFVASTDLSTDFTESDGIFQRKQM